MTRTERKQSVPLSCDGCVFSRQTYGKKSIKDPSNPKRKKVVDIPTGLYGCHAPKGDLYDNCMERGVIFTGEKAEAYRKD